jgi:SAM-dependent methyltransferase
MSARREWADALAAWAIPPEILAKAPVDPWSWPVSMRVRATEHALAMDSPSLRRAREALPDGGSVLDVGCGAGAASLPLCPPAASVIGVDSDEDVLTAFADQAARRGVRHKEVVGSWPDASDDVAATDVVVCNHVLYNIPDVGPFVAALADHARSRTVIEITSEHPRAWHGPLWKALHGIDRPTRPTIDDLVAVLTEVGIEAQVERWMRATPMKDTPHEEEVAMIRVALCLPEERDPEVARALQEHPAPTEREITTLWWDRE